MLVGAGHRADGRSRREQRPQPGARSPSLRGRTTSVVAACAELGAAVLPGRRDADRARARPRSAALSSRSSRRSTVGGPAFLGPSPRRSRRRGSFRPAGSTPRRSASYLACPPCSPAAAPGSPTAQSIREARLRRDRRAAREQQRRSRMIQPSSSAREECRYDLVALGEVMLRLDPGDGRIATRARRSGPGRAAASTTWRAGCAAASGSAPAIVTALADNPVGRLIEDLMLQGGVDAGAARVAHLRRHRARGPQRAQLHRARLRRARRRRLLRPRALGRVAAAAGRRRLGRIFGGEGARWFHTGGVFCALSETARERSRSRPSRRRAATARSSPTT